jgi:secondary thiamine-phosphate synthase enzyme
MQWSQRTIELGPQTRGIHLVTREILEALPELRTFEVGLLHLFIQHTSASLTLNENADPDVRDDLDRSMDALAPESFPYTHTAEGPDDMPAHVKASLLGSSLSIPIRDGALALGTWQGICLCEHRAGRHRRRLVATVFGQKRMPSPATIAR